MGAIALIVGVVVVVLRLGDWIVSEDPLAHGVAIVVLNGETPFRADEAARLYRQGWAAEIWLTQDPQSSDAARAARGEVADPGTALNIATLVTAGVPRRAVRVLPGAARGTAEELRTIGREVRARGGGTVLFVTSPFHTRRVRLLGSRQLGVTAPIVVRAAPTPRDAAPWWSQPEQRRLLAHEIVALVVSAVRPGGDR